MLSYAQSREGSSDFEAFGEDLRQQMMSVAGEMEQGLGTQQDQMTWTPRKGYRVQMSTIFDEESRARSVHYQQGINRALLTNLIGCVSVCVLAIFENELAQRIRNNE